MKKGKVKTIKKKYNNNKNINWHAYGCNIKIVAN